MANVNFLQALVDAQDDLEKATAQLDYWTMEVAKAQTLVKALAVKCGDEIIETIEEAPDRVGIQEVVFSCIRTTYLAPTAKDIRDQIQSKQLYDLSRYSNSLAVIHQALKRLEKAEKIKPVGDGKYCLNLAGILGNAFRNMPEGALEEFMAELAKNKNK